MTGQPKIHYRADEALNQDLFPGGAIQFIHGEGVTFAVWSFEPGTKVAPHVHPHEQITHCVSGLLLLNIAGTDIELGPGESAVIPGNVPHSAAADVPTRGVDVFCPVREDYKFS